MQRALPWADRAACRGEPNDRTFFPDLVLGRARFVASPTILLPLLICERCPVRRPCLETALADYAGQRVDIAANGKPVHVSDHAMPTSGVWGGTTDLERLAVKKLPVSEAADLLERTFPDRLRRRVAAYKARRASPRSKASKRVDELLREREALGRIAS